MVAWLRWQGIGGQADPFPERGRLSGLAVIGPTVAAGGEVPLLQGLS
jgi:hypothetical protein